MKRLIWFGIAVLLIAFGLLIAGCGKEGPMGPTGPAGSAGAPGDPGQPGAGTQTVYNFTVTPAYAVDWYILACPAVKADVATGTFSTVMCYIKRSGYYSVIPGTFRELDGTTTFIEYGFQPGTVKVQWANSGTTVPAALEIMVTVVNR